MAKIMQGSFLCGPQATSALEKETDTELKTSPKKKKSKTNSQAEIKQMLMKDNICYVLITCKAPSEDGKMEVEMRYEGDECLAAYLIDTAQGLIEFQ